MKKSWIVLPAMAVMFALAFCACATPAAVPQGTTGQSAAPASAQSPTAAPQAAASAAFKYYGEVDLGMTKDAVDKATGLSPQADTTDVVPEGQTAFKYLDANGEGVYVLFDKDSKLTSKTVQYNEAAEALAPLTAKRVTEDQCKQIADGMPHADVTKLLGCEGAECSKTQSIIIGKIKVDTIWRWGNPDGSFIQVLFMDNGTAKNATFFD